MADKGTREPQGFDVVDADAVCIQCGAVNPEGSILCKECGNNLREQRQRRIQGEQAPGIEGPGRVRVFTGIITGFGILIVILAALNISTIESWLVSVQETEVDLPAPEDIWTGELGAEFDVLRVQLSDAPSSKEKRQAAIDELVRDELFNGRYVLFRQEELTGLEILGEAILTRRGDRIYFVALLDRGIEVRGIAWLVETESGEIQPTVYRSGGVLIDGQVFDVLGRAERHESGAMLVLGQSSQNEEAEYYCLASYIR